MALMGEAVACTGVGPACQAIGISRADYYRRKQPKLSATPTADTPPKQSGRPRSLTPAVEADIVAHLNSERFLDCAVRHVYATLLDEGVYLCSWRSMYRLLARQQQVKERRNLRRHPKYSRPELAAVAPNQVWTWDITYLKAELRGKFYYLYVVIDLFSRYVVGWMLAERECGELATRLLEQSYRKQRVEPGKLTLHSDRGTPMKSKPVKQLLYDLGVVSSYSRPRVSNDNPFSESGFKTLKYHPDFPARFSSFAEAEQFCQGYFVWYNTQHYHTGIALLTPAQVHYGDPTALLAARHQTILAAYAKCPARFGYRPPRLEVLPEAVYINPPAKASAEEAA